MSPTQPKIGVTSSFANKKMIPDNYIVPLTHSLGDLWLQPLSLALSARDYTAVMESQERIRNVFGPENCWPPSTLTSGENTADIARHQADFEARRAFTYSLLTVGTNEYCGCFYIKKIKSRHAVDFRKQAFDAQAFFWLCERYFTPERDAKVAVDLRAWLASAWPLKNVAWPNRGISWADWQKAEIDINCATLLYA